MDAEEHCKLRFHNESPKLPELKQGHVLRLIREISKYNAGEMNCFVSLKATSKVCHINFVACHKGNQGAKLEDRIIQLIEVACSYLDVPQVHYDVDKGEEHKTKALRDYGMTPCPDFTCWALHQAWLDQVRVCKILNEGDRVDLTEQ